MREGGNNNLRKTLDGEEEGGQERYVIVSGLAGRAGHYRTLPDCSDDNKHACLR